MPVSRRAGSEIGRPERGDPERGESGIAIPRRQRRDDRGQRLARHRRRDGALVEHVGRAVGERTDALGPAQFDAGKGSCLRVAAGRSEEHTSELQSLMRISYAVFCLKKKNYQENNQNINIFFKSIYFSTE